jgi:glycosyltransferase involved in cell wall biosynthesis
MTKPLISVILPVYNGADYLSDAIESILSQTFKDFELILINDGSSDNSLSIAQVYKDQDSRVVLVSQKNIGLVATLNKGISLAKGQFIARMDQDDISLENRFLEQIKLLETGYDLCGCHFHFITESGQLSKSRVVSINTDFQSIILTRSTPFAHGSVMIRKSFLDENNLKYSHEKYTSAEDYYLWVQCFEHGAKITNVDEYLFLYRDFDLSLSKLNARNNLKDAQDISRRFIAKNFVKIEDNLKQRLSDKSILNSFEQEQLAFFVFNTLFKRGGGKTKYYLSFITPDIKIVAFFRFLKCFFKF